MDLLQISFAFSLGLMSFISPCVLPLIPGYMAYLFANEKLAKAMGAVSIFSGILFGAMLIGALLSALGEVSTNRYFYLASAFLLILLILDKAGLRFIKPFSFPWLHRKKGMFVGFIFGLLMIFVASPCSIPLLVITSILALSLLDLFLRVILLLAYALGLGLPFIAISLITASSKKLMEFVKAKHVQQMQLLIMIATLAWLIWIFASF